MAATFCLYDFFVYRRNTKVVHAAARSNALVSSLFPTTVKERLLDEANRRRSNGSAGPKLSAQQRKVTDSETLFMSQPIAEQYPDTTILFGGKVLSACPTIGIPIALPNSSEIDLAGFTAWSSSREPSQVFTLLETL